MAKGMNVTVDLNKALDQAEALADRLWQGLSGSATNVVVAVANNTRWDWRHMGGFQWQGITTDPAEDIKAGEVGGWRVYSTGLDGSFSMQTWQLSWGKMPAFLNVGELVYATRAQPKFTANLSAGNMLGDGSNAAKLAAIKKLDEGRSSSWTQDVSVPGPDASITSFEVRRVVTGPMIDVEYGMTLLVTVTEKA